MKTRKRSENLQEFIKVKWTFNLAIVGWMSMFLSILIFSDQHISSRGLGNTGNYYRILLVIFSALAGLFCVFNNSHRLHKAFSVPVVLFLFYGAYSTITGLYIPEHSLYSMWKGGEVFVVCLLIVGVLSDRRPVESTATAYNVLVSMFAALLIVYLVEAMFVPSLALVPVPGGVLPFQLKGVTPISNSNTLGFASAVVAFSALCKICLKNFYNERKANQWVFFIVGFVSLILSQSRSCIAGFFAAVCLFLFFGKQYKRLFIFVCISASLFLGAELYEFVQAFVLRGQTPEHLANLSGRVSVWEVAWERVWEAPFLGHGFVAFSRSEILGIGGSSHLHSTILEILVGTGFVGLSLWSGGVILTGFRLMRFSRIPASQFRSMFAGPTPAEMLGILCLVLSRAFTSSGPAMHDHSFMILIAVVGYTAMITHSMKSKHWLSSRKAHQNQSFVHTQV